ncbi:MAG TPA: kelch repeat-containing protein, partial [Acidimicrobiales bacterium]|nr:kelch repeat-containing protein [Acidimicrobiales bacterium]
DDRVLVAGSRNHGAVFDPIAQTWARTGGMAAVQSQAAAVRLADGRVLLAGGTTPKGAESLSELYDPATNSWQRGPDLHAAVGATAAIRLPNGAVLLAGGAHGPVAARTAQEFVLPGQAAPFLRAPAARSSNDRAGGAHDGRSPSGPERGTAGTPGARASADAGSGSNDAVRWLVVGGVVIALALLGSVVAWVVTRRRPTSSDA